MYPYNYNRYAIIAMARSMMKGGVLLGLCIQ
jgi:hypothetical protein